MEVGGEDESNHEAPAVVQKSATASRTTETLQEPSYR